MGSLLDDPNSWASRSFTSQGLRAGRDTRALQPCSPRRYSSGAPGIRHRCRHCQFYSGLGSWPGVLNRTLSRQMTRNGVSFAADADGEIGAGPRRHSGSRNRPAARHPWYRIGMPFFFAMRMNRGAQVGFSSISTSRCFSRMRPAGAHSPRLAATRPRCPSLPVGTRKKMWCRRL